MTKKPPTTLDEAPGIIGTGLSMAGGMLGRLATKGVKKAYTTYKNTDRVLKKDSRAAVEKWMVQINKDWLKYANSQGLDPSAPTNVAKLRDFVLKYYREELPELPPDAATAEGQEKSGSANTGKVVGGKSAMSAAAMAYQNKVMSTLNARFQHVDWPDFKKEDVLPLLDELVKHGVDHGGAEKNRVVGYLKWLSRRAAIRAKMGNDMAELMRQLAEAYVASFAVFLMEHGVRTKQDFAESYHVFFEADAEKVFSPEQVQSTFLELARRLLSDPAVLTASMRFPIHSQKYNQYVAVHHRGHGHEQKTKHDNSSETKRYSGNPNYMDLKLLRRHLLDLNVPMEEITAMVKAVEKERSLASAAEYVKKYSGTRIANNLLAAVLYTYADTHR